MKQENSYCPPESHRLTPAEFLSVRLLSGHTQASFAQALGKSQVTISNYENGRCRVPAEFTCALYGLLPSCEDLICAYVSAKRKILLEMSREGNVHRKVTLVPLSDARNLQGPDERLYGNPSDSITSSIV